MGLSTPFLKKMLKKRCKTGKEDPQRLNERMGIASKKRPDGPLLWMHAASVGEAQSMLILIDALKAAYKDIHILVTTGTVTSAELMGKRLSGRAFHQYYPLDHPKWVGSFLDHWQPDFVIWMESELWPNMLAQIGKRDIRAAIINARLSDKSYARWKKSKRMAAGILDVFDLIMPQTESYAAYFRDLCNATEKVVTSGNLKYSAAPLPYDDEQLQKLKKAVGERPFWLYASTHDGEEDLACRLHQKIQRDHPDLLTIIVPRHPERRDAIKAQFEKFDLQHVLRGDKKTLPDDNTQIYVADTLGEMGLFYELSPIACIGRSFSNDGGGGHNPIEAAQMHCAVLHGPRVQNLQQIFDEMDKEGAAIKLKDENDFATRLNKILHDEEGLIALQNKAYRFVSEKSDIIDRVMQALKPLTDEAFAQTKQDDKKCA